MPPRNPPRFVPTLTEVVNPDAPQASAAPYGRAAEAARAKPPGLSEEQLVHRVMQRIDLTLDGRLREAIAATVLAHTRELGPLLRDEIEQVVRQAVSQAFADELDADAGERR